MPKLTVVVQAGGESRRMRQDKGLVPFLGRTLIERVIDRVSPAADELIVTTNNLDEYKFLGLPLYSDLIQGTGALGGLYTALHAAGHPRVAVVACDMPFASPKLLRRALMHLITMDVAAVVPRSQAGLEPFHAVYDRTCLPYIYTALQAQKRRLDSWFHTVKLYQMPWETVLQIEPSGRVFMNLNTPEELAAAQEIAHTQDS